MAGWAGPKGEAEDLVLVEDVCPTCGQHVEDRHGPHREVRNETPRRWPLGLAAGILVLVGAIAVARQSGDDDPSSAAASSTTASPETSSSSTTTPRPSTTVRPTPSTTAPPADPPQITADAAGLPAELTALRYVVGGRLAQDTWIVDLQGRAEPLWEGASPPRDPMNVIATSAGTAVVTESAMYLRGDGTMTRLPARNAWPRPLLSDQGIWQIRETSGIGGTYGVLEHRSLDGRTLLEEVSLPTWGWVLGLLDGRPLLSSSGVASGAFRADAGATFERVSEGSPLYYAAGHVVETFCDERLECQVRVVDLATGSITPIGDGTPANDLQVVASSADGIAVVFATWDQRGPHPVAVNMATGVVTPFGPAADDLLRSSLQRVEWGPVGPTGLSVDPAGRYLMAATKDGIEAVDLASDQTYSIALTGGTEVLTVLAPGA